MARIGWALMGVDAVVRIVLGSSCGSPSRMRWPSGGTPVGTIVARAQPAELMLTE